MIRLAFTSGSLSGQVFRSEGPSVRVGRSAGAELRFDSEQDPQVSYHHAELVLERGSWYAVDAESERGLFVNGRRVSRRKLEVGNTLRFGEGGPQARVEAADEEREEEAGEVLPALRERTYRELATSAKEAEADPSPPPSAPPPSRSSRSSAEVAQEIARRVAEERALAGGQSSGKTTFIMADAIEQVDRQAKRATRRRWVQIVAAVGGAAVLVSGGLGVVVWVQQRQIADLISEKGRIDEEIRGIYKQMEVETDEGKLGELQARLDLLSGSADSALAELRKSGRADATKAAEDSEGDQLDRDLREVLKKFNAETYSVPPVFKEQLRFHIDDLLKNRDMDLAQKRKARLWPIISKALEAHEMPAELGYITYVESSFNPMAYNDKAGACGMWQLIPATGSHYGLRVSDCKTGDERTDPEKSSRAAARYLSNLLIEFGEQSVLLVLASYNKGEAGVRRALHKVASEPGGYRKRDFWHLYLRKLLPEETCKYVPKVVATAIVLEHPERYLGTAPPSTEADERPW